MGDRSTTGMPTSVPLIGGNGLIDPAWVAWFEAFYRRSAGQAAIVYGGLVTVAFDGDVAGYVPADGRALSCAAYPQTFARVGTQYGSGSGSDGPTFNAPTVSDDGVRRWLFRVDD